MRTVSNDSDEHVDGLPPKELLRVAVFDSVADPDAAEQAAAEEQQIRAEIDKCLPGLEVLELLGRGGMGYVYRARQKKLEREVALKVLSPRAEPQAGFSERFEREAKALARLSHPNLVAVYDYGQDDGFAWLLMEYVDGPNLRQVMEAGRLEPDEALALVPKICEALQYAHDRGVVHRDVKPENILLDGACGVKIADFGLAKLVGTRAALVDLTGSQQVLGTFRYMAPEQLDRPLEVDHRADIYSLGVVFYEMLTGEIPMGRFDPPSRGSKASPAVDPVVLRSLEREPGRRYQSAAEVKSDLEGAVRRGTTAPVMEDGSAASATASRKLSMQAVFSAVLFGLGAVPCVPLFVMTWISVAASRRTPLQAAAEGQMGVAALVVLLPAFLGLVLIAVATVLGFQALAGLRRDWPRRYGVGAAVVGAWTGILLVGNVAVVAGLVRLGHLEEILPRVLLLLMPTLWVADTLFLFVYRRRFLARLEESAP